MARATSACISVTTGGARHQRRRDHHFLQHCAAEGAAVFVQPWDMMVQDGKCQVPAPVAGGHAANAAVDPVVESCRAPSSACRARSAVASRTAAVAFRTFSGGRQCVAQPRCRARGLPASAVLLRRRFLCDCRRVQRRRTPFSSNHGRRPRHARFRLSFPPREQTVGSLIPLPRDAADADPREAAATPTPTAFFGLDAGSSALSGAAPRAAAPEHRFSSMTAVDSSAWIARKSLAPRRADRRRSMECRRILRPPKRLNAHPPTLTKALQDVEATLDLPRRAHQPRARADAVREIFARPAKIVLAPAAARGRGAERSARRHSGKVTVGHAAAASASILPDAIARLKMARPAVASAS